MLFWHKFCVISVGHRPQPLISGTYRRIEIMPDNGGVVSIGLKGGTIMSGYTNATNGTNQESPGVPAVRKALSGAWAWCVRLVYEHTALVLAIILFVTMAGALWHLSRISIELVQSETAAKCGLGCVPSNVRYWG